MTTYLEIINEVLRDVNEVPLKAVNFSSARGIQDFVKKAVNRAYMDIVVASAEWSWLLDTSGTDGNITTTLVKGQRYYALGEHHNLDLDTVLLTDSEGTSFDLDFSSYDEWHHHERTQETEELDEGRPRKIFKHPGSTLYGVSPIPDEPYTLTYTKWTPATKFTADTDVIPFSAQYENVLINRALFYTWMFRENLDHANMINKTFEAQLDNMKKQLVISKLVTMRAR